MSSLPSIKELVSKDNRVRFRHYRQGELWYDVIGYDRIEDGDFGQVTWKPKVLFTFPVPITDTGDATFAAEDKALLFMRWIRKELAARKEADE